ncbi:helix-turn-helix domain-containing protein [Marivita sp.]|uniref:helix-turn-helix domain-containing protein n=1 Tax=Marivita sp. TaxID=2003365 RepID=UPI003F6CD4A3
MYNPKGHGKERSIDAVVFNEATPPAHLKDVVHRVLELRTTTPLAQDYRFHALPDAATYIIFDQMNPDVTGVTRLQASSEELNLGTAFHFVNIRFLPGVWQPHLEPISHGIVESHYSGSLPLASLNQTLSTQDFDAQQKTLFAFVDTLVERGIVIANPVTEKIFHHIDDIHTVADMAEIAGLSTRQLQRCLKETTGFTPHDFLKVLRLQQSLKGEPSLAYADQSHFIHSFRKATGYTPGRFAKKFDV